MLLAANAALARGDTQQAAGFYERVVNTPPSNDEGTASATVVTSFAEFRAMVTLLANGQEDQAREHLDALQKRDPDAPLARLATQIWDQYGMTGQVRSACAQARPQVASQAGSVLTALQSAGVTIDANNLCGVG